jgi:hypothetical protein
MSELNFPTKLIRLTKATLTTVTCCVKIQNDCNESFETRQGLRQGDVSSTLLFNAVLEVIVRRANLQTTGTIYNKKINEQKTKYMIAARNNTTIRDGKAWQLATNTLTPTNDVSLKIQRRIQTANRCFFGLRKHLQSSHLSRQTKFLIHKTLIRPVLLYGSET